MILDTRMIRESEIGIVSSIAGQRAHTTVERLGTSTDPSSRRGGLSLIRLPFFSSAARFPIASAVNDRAAIDESYSRRFTR